MSARVPRVELTCGVCGVVFERRATEIGRSKTGQFFCSRRCCGRGTLKPKTGIEDACVTCGAPVYRQRFQLEAGTGRFCSKACHDIKQTKEHLVFTCEACGKVFDLKPSQAEHQAGRFCSLRCMGLANIKRPLRRQHNGKPARLDGHGYVLVWEPDHHNAQVMKGWVYEHRLVAEGIIGRPLTPDDEVHHVNRIKDDNRPENLQVLDGKTHAVVTTTQRRADRELLHEYIRRYGPLT